MPYKSEAQRAKFHVLLEQGKIDPATVHEFDQASRGLKLPHRAGPPTHRAAKQKIASAHQADLEKRKQHYGS